MDPDEAFASVASGTPWFFHWCAGTRTTVDDATSEEAMRVARSHCISAAERDRLAKKSCRKGRTKTVVMAELWEHPVEGPLIVFLEDGPYAWPEREDPRRRP